MNRRNIAGCGVLALALMSFLFYCPAVAWLTQSFDDIDSQSIHSGLGAIEFRVQLLKGVSSDPHEHVLLLAVSSDADESY